MVVVLILALAGPQEISAADRKKLEAARAAVEKSPDDAKANLDLGRMLCLFMGEWVEGLPFLAKGGDKSFSPIAEKDLQPRATVEDSLAMADEWLKLAKVQKQYAARLQERALFHYAEAWPRMDLGPAREAMRERVKALQQKAPESKVLGAAPAGWPNASQNQRCGMDREYARSGQWSVKMLSPDPKVKAFQSWIASQDFPCAAGAKVTFSCWVLTDRSDGGDKLQVKFRDAKQGADAQLSLVAVRVEPDFPVWRKVEGEAVAPEGTTRVEISFGRSNTKAGVAFLDDFSMKINGVEVVKNAGFELK
jgi:hypothetical protein